MTVPGRRPRAPASGQKRGFAIIISITLLAFLVLLLLSLVLLTRVGTQVSSNNLQLAQAQQNALAALNIAVGQLDKFAGPDQRITAPAEFGNPTLNNQASNIPWTMSGSNTTLNLSVPVNPGWAAMGVVTPVAGDRQWTGVYGNRNPPGQIFTETPTPVLLDWLVSGNEGASTGTVTTYGQVITVPPATGLTFKPNMAVTPTLSATTSYGTPLVITGSTTTSPAILLVGPNSTGTQTETLSYPTALSGTTSITGRVNVTSLPQDRFVVAPLVTISVSANLLPGFSGTAPKLVGRFGYAVLDEGVKAKISVRDPFDGSSTTAQLGSTSTYSARARMESSQRTGIELVQGFNDSNNSPVTGSISYPVNSTNSASNMEIEQVLSLSQARYLDPTATSSTVDAALQLRFHDLTTHSFGVESDVQRGGLRRDLTAMFEDSAVFASYTGLNILPDRDEPTYDLASKSSLTGLLTSLDPAMLDPSLTNITTNYTIGGTYTISPTRVSPKSQFAYTKNLGGVPVENHGPTWDRLRNFYQLSNTITVSGPATATNAGAKVNVQAADPAHIPITPVLVQLRLYFGMNNLSGNFGLRHFITIILGNPYSVDLVAPKGLNFVFRQPGLNNNVAAYSQNQVGTGNSHGSWNVALSSSAGSQNNAGDVSWSSSVFTAFTNPRQNFVLAPAGTVLPIVNSGLGSVVNTDQLQQNWQPVPDPLASTMGSVLFHASNSGSAGASLTIPAGKLMVLIINGSGQTVNNASTFSTPPLVQMVPNTNGAINSASYVYNSGQSIGAGKYTNVNYGDNLSLYMLDPNYTPLAGDTQTYSAGGAKIGRVLQAIIGFNMTQGQEAVNGSLQFSDGNQFDGGSFIENLALAKGTPWNETGSNVAGITFSRGNYFRTYLDYGLTNVYRAVPTALPNGPWWHISNCGTVNGYISSFDNDGQANNTLNGFPVYTNGLTFANSFGWGYDTDTIYENSSTVMFDLPRRPVASGAGNPEEPIMSLGYLRHANLSADDEYLSPGYQPASQIGQSFFTPQVTRTASLQLRPNLYFTGMLHPNTAYYDMSYLLNAAVWDSYFFSTIPSAATSIGQPDNPRLKFATGLAPTVANLGVGASAPTATVSDPQNPGQYIPKEYVGARYLMIDGAFNINSTSVEAWKAELASLRRRPAGNTDKELSSKPSAFPLSLAQPFDSTGADNVGDYSAPNNFGAHGGFRRLTDQQIDTLATNIVLEIRQRGPFLSLAHLINRTGLTGTVSSTLSISSTDAADLYNVHTLIGTLQTAIERAGLNSNFPGQPLVGTSLTSHSATSTDYVLGVYTKGYSSGSVQNLYADTLPTGTNTTLTFSMATLDRSAGVPGWFTQADLLQALGPSLAARSDTFVVRAYGDVVDPINTTDATKPVILARAWCEAVVQRFPDYTDPTNEPYVYPTKADKTNQLFGRKFRIVSFRWLSPNDI